MSATSISLVSQHSIIVATSSQYSPPSHSPTSNSSNGSPASSNTLYLYTFLTTLLLLLAVSCGIIFRSFVLRRRFRQRVEEAIAAGVLLPDGRLAPGLSGGRRGFDFGAKPIMYEVWMEHHSNSKGEKWEDLKPISATVVRHSIVAPPTTLDLPAPPNTTQPHGRFNPRTLVQNFRSLGFGSGTQGTRGSYPTPGNVPQTTAYGLADIQSQQQQPLPNATGDVTPTPNASDNLVLSVLIAMPNPSRPTYIPNSLQPPFASSYSGLEQETLSVKGKAKLSTSPTRTQDEEEELPDVVFGVSELLWSKEMELQEQPVPSSAENGDTERRA